MTRHDGMELLRAKVAEFGQAEVARRIGKSDSAISQILKGDYKGSPDNILQKVAEVFGTSADIDCPAVQDKITPGKCAEIRNRPPVWTSPHSNQLWRACKECERRK